MEVIETVKRDALDSMDTLFASSDDTASRTVVSRVVDPGFERFRNEKGQVRQLAGPDLAFQWS